MSDPAVKAQECKGKYALFGLIQVPLGELGANQDNRNGLGVSGMHTHNIAFGIATCNPRMARLVMTPSALR